MEEKIKEILPEADIEKIHEDYFTVSDNTFNSINEMQQTITTLIGIFYSAYQETGDERFLVAAKGQIKLFQKEIEEKIDDTFKVIENVSNALKQYNMGILKLIPSPILGGSGNKEFLAYIKRNVESKVNIIEVCK